MLHSARCNRWENENVIKVADKLCAHENVVALLFIIAAEKNKDQWEMTKEVNK